MEASHQSEWAAENSLEYFLKWLVYAYYWKIWQVLMTAAKFLNHTVNHGTKSSTCFVLKFQELCELESGSLKILISMNKFCTGKS